MAFSVDDKRFMKLALNEAKKALDKGDYPVGAVLVIDGRVVGSIHNTLHTDTDWVSHAELLLIKSNSKIIKDAVKTKNSKITLYSTLEPCLMCLGTCVLNRVTRIVYACPDPHGGVTHINPKKLTDWYIRKWPVIEGGLFKDKSYDYMVFFMKKQNTPGWSKILKLFEKIK